MNLITYCGEMEDSKKESITPINFKINEFCYDNINIIKLDTIS